MNQRFTKKPTRQQVKLGLALFALAKPLTDDARKARQAHAIKAEATNDQPDDCEEVQDKTTAPRQEKNRAEAKVRGSIGRPSHGGAEPQSSGDFWHPETTTGSA